MQLAATNKLEKVYKLQVKGSDAKAASCELSGAGKAKECTRQHKTGISNVKAEYSARIHELEADHKKDLAREEAQGKKSCKELKSRESMRRI